MEDRDHEERQGESRGDHIRRVLEDCLDRRLLGETVTDETLTQAHPDLMPELAEELGKLRLIEAARKQAGEGFGGDPSIGLNPERHAATHIRCPHCLNAIELIEVQQLEEVVCPSCGSSFSLAPGPTAAWTPKQGDRRLGKFEIVDQLGVGAFGTVYMARDPELDRVVAIKVPRAGNLAGDEEFDRFLREARSVAQLRHPNIVPVYEVGHSDGMPFLVSEYVQGATLMDRLTSDRLSFRQSAELIANVAEALHYAHEQGVIHRDVKPSNIMLDMDDQPHLMDFGLAKREAGEVTMTLDGQVIGTPAYMSPEQARGEAHTVDARSDVYSVGVILYELVTGELPFRGNSRMLIVQVLRDEPRAPRRLNDHISRDLETICLKAIAKEPGRRYQTALVLVEDLRRFLDGQPIRARPVGRVERAQRWCRRNPTTAALTASVLTLLVVIAVGASIAALVLRDRASKLRDQASDLRDQRNTALTNLQRAERAEKDNRERLFKSFRDQGRAKRWSGRAGQRFDSLEALRAAAEILPSVDWSLGGKHEQRLELRNEAIACMTLADLRVAKQWEAKSAPNLLATYAGDATLDRYAEQDREGNITVRRMADDRELFRLPGYGRPAWTAYFSPDGRLLAARYHDHGPADVYVWDLDRRESPVLKIKNGPVHRALSFSRDSRLLAVGRYDNSISIYDVKSGEQLISTSPGPVPNRLCFDPDGKALAVSSVQGRQVQIRSVQTGEVLHTWRHPGGVRGISWHPDGKQLATGCVDHRVRIFDVESGQEKMVLEGHRQLVVQVAFNSSGDLLASCGYQTTRLWDPATGRQLLSTPGRCGRFSLDGRRLFGWSGRQVWYWEVATGRECRTLPTERPRQVDIHRDGRLLAAATGAGVRLWDVATCREVAFLKIGKTNSAVFHPNGKELITSGNIGVCRWPIERPPDPTRKPTKIGPAERVLLGRMGRIALSANGQTMSVDTGSAQTLVVDLSKPTRRRVLGAHPGVHRVPISPDGRWVATSTWQKTGIKVWDANTGKLVNEPAPDSATAAVRFSPDGKWLVGSLGHEYRFWHVGSWQFSHKLKRASSDAVPGQMAFTRDGKMMAIAVTRRTLQLIDPHTGKQFATLEAPDPQSLGWLCFSPDGSYLAAVAGRGIQLWDLRLIRAHLNEMGLDWDLPSPSSSGGQTPAPIRVDVQLGVEKT